MCWTCGFAIQNSRSDGATVQGGQTLVATRHLVLGFDRFTEVGVSPIGTNPGECKVDAVTQGGVRRPFARLLWALVYVTLRTARPMRTGS